MLIYENIVSGNFVQKVKNISARLDIDPNWLMAVIKKESNFNRTATNSYSGAVGLIQFLPSTLKSQFGMTPSQMKALSGWQQLDYVERYLLPYRNRMTNYTDTYLAVFYPSAIGKSDDYIFPKSVYQGNKKIDTNVDGVLSVSDIKKWLMKDIPVSWKKTFEEKRSVWEKFMRRNWLWISTISLIIMILTYYALNYFLK